MTRKSLIGLITRRPELSTPRNIEKILELDEKYFVEALEFAERFIDQLNFVFTTRTEKCWVPWFWGSDKGYLVVNQLRCNDSREYGQRFRNYIGLVVTVEKCSSGINVYVATPGGCHGLRNNFICLERVSKANYEVTFLHEWAHIFRLICGKDIMWQHEEATVEIMAITAFASFGTRRIRSWMEQSEMSFDEFVWPTGRKDYLGWQRNALDRNMMDYKELWERLLSEENEYTEFD